MKVSPTTPFTRYNHTMLFCKAQRPSQPQKHLTWSLLATVLSGVGHVGMGCTTSAMARVILGLLRVLFRFREYRDSERIVTTKDKQGSLLH